MVLLQISKPIEAVVSSNKRHWWLIQYSNLRLTSCTPSSFLHRYYTPTKQNTPPILTYIYVKFTQPQVAFYKFLVTYAFFAYFLLGFPFAITNHLGDALFRSFAWKFTLCTASTLQLASTQNLRKIPISKARSVFARVTENRSTVESILQTRFCTFFQAPISNVCVVFIGANKVFTFDCISFIIIATYVFA